MARDHSQCSMSGLAHQKTIESVAAALPVTFNNLIRLHNGGQHRQSFKLAAVRGWVVSKLGVKGAFLNAPLPKDELILVQPPKQWVDWGIVGKDVVWKLNRAVYGLRQSPKWWSDERDSRLKELRFCVGSETYHLQQNDADSQVWMIKQVPLSGRAGPQSDSMRDSEQQLL